MQGVRLKQKTVRERERAVCWPHSPGLSDLFSGGLSAFSSLNVQLTLFQLSCVHKRSEACVSLDRILGNKHILRIEWQCHSCSPTQATLSLSLALSVAIFRRALLILPFLPLFHSFVGFECVHSCKVECKRLYFLYTRRHWYIVCRTEKVPCLYNSEYYHAALDWIEPNRISFWTRACKSLKLCMH